MPEVLLGGMNAHDEMAANRVELIRMVEDMMAKGLTARDVGRQCKLTSWQVTRIQRLLAGNTTTGGVKRDIVDLVKTGYERFLNGDHTWRKAPSPSITFSPKATAPKEPPKAIITIADDAPVLLKKPKAPEKPKPKVDMDVTGALEKKFGVTVAFTKQTTKQRLQKARRGY